MKLSPFMIFLILLIVLVISVIFINNTANTDNLREGLITFQQTTSNNATITIPAYSTVNNVTKINDDIFYDPINGNLIEVDGLSTGTNPDTAGASIQEIYITPRDNFLESSIYSIGGSLISQKTPESLINSISDSYNTYTYQNQSPNSVQSVAVYTAWKNMTCINTCVNSNKQTGSNGANITHITDIYSYLFMPNTPSSYVAMTISPFISGFYPDYDPHNGTYVTEPLYSTTSTIYQLSHYVKYDPNAGNLILLSGTSPHYTITTYGSNGNVINNGESRSTEYGVTGYGSTSHNTATLSTSTTTSTDSNFNSWSIIDPNGHKLIIFNSINSSSAIIVLGSYADKSMKNFEFKESFRFNHSGLDYGSGQVSKTNAPVPDTPTCGMNHSYDQVQVFNPHYNNPDYILKTQIVPPVCPTCPSCPACTAGTACTNCGGQGGNGTLSQTGSSVVDGSHDIIQNTGSGVKNLVEDTGSGVKNLVENTGSGVKNLVENTGSGVKNLVENTGSGVKNFVENTGSGIKSFLSAPGSSPAAPGSSPAAPGSSPAGTATQLGTQNQYSNPSPIDQYSYYGQLPDKGTGNFMPLTSDFSRFGR